MKALFVYGSLGPGKPNEHKLQKIGGFWKKGFVRGKLFDEGWGSKLGFPGIRIDDQAEIVEGDVFFSENLESYLKVMDEFEGADYIRSNTRVQIKDSDEQVEAYIYVLR